MWFNLIYCPHRVSREKKETERIKERKLSRPPRHHHCSDSLCLVVVVIECSSLHTVQGIIMTLFWWMIYDLTSFNNPSIKIKFSYDWIFYSNFCIWFCTDFAVILFWFCCDFLWSCCNSAVILLWFCCDSAVILLWILLWSCFYSAVILLWFCCDSTVIQLYGFTNLNCILLWFHSDLLKKWCWLYNYISMYFAFNPLRFF